MSHNAAKNTITVTLTRKGEKQEQTFELAKDALGKLEVKPGMHVSLKLSKDQKTVQGVKEVKADKKPASPGDTDKPKK